jgi:large subunit ribosomal protein L7Ae
LEILKKYTPESRKQKSARLKKAAEEKIKTGDKKAKVVKKVGDKPISLKYGLKHVTYLIEQKKAKLVMIANDVEPIELVIFLPTLCKAMDIPYCIVQSNDNMLIVDKARLGKLCHKKSAAVVCLTDFKDHQTELANITRICRDSFNNVVQTFKKPEKGIKSQIRERQMAKVLQAEAAKKA